eukprot:m.44131 g.44131  ORF g.44131 m.44131 type:complete len:58 (+) comp15078_c0_seq1:299-472(+)
MVSQLAIINPIAGSHVPRMEQNCLLGGSFLLGTDMPCAAAGIVEMECGHPTIESIVC